MRVFARNLSKENPPMKFCIRRDFKRRETEQCNFEFEAILLEGKLANVCHFAFQGILNEGKLKNLDLNSKGFFDPSQMLSDGIQRCSPNTHAASAISLTMAKGTTNAALVFLISSSISIKMRFWLYLMYPCNASNDVCGRTMTLRRAVNTPNTAEQRLRFPPPNTPDVTFKVRTHCCTLNQISDFNSKYRIWHI